jgi:hypothetical protein
LFGKSKGIKRRRTIVINTMKSEDKPEIAKDYKEAEKSLRNLVNQDKGNKPEEFEEAMQKVWNPET